MLRDANVNEKYVELTPMSFIPMRTCIHTFGMYSYKLEYSLKTSLRGSVRFDVCSQQSCRAAAARQLMLLRFFFCLCDIHVLPQSGSVVRVSHRHRLADIAARRNGNAPDTELSDRSSSHSGAAIFAHYKSIKNKEAGQFQLKF